MVKAPYNILANIKEEQDGSISAQVKNEFKLLTECGPISASEAGRHLAILGSIALSKNNESPNYYLANRAVIKRELDATPSKAGKQFYLNTKVTFKNQKTGTILGEIADENNGVIYSIEVSYQTIHPRIFAKIFKQFLNTTPIVNNVSPYQYRQGLANKSIHQDEISASYGPITANECEGHFENYPALPVAVICNLFAELGSSLLFHNYENELSNFVTKEATIYANRLVFSGEKLTFKGVKVEDRLDSSMLITSSAYVDDKKVAGAEFIMQGIYKDSAKEMVLETEEQFA